MESASAPYFRALAISFSVYGMFRLARVIGWFVFSGTFGSMVLAAAVLMVFRRRSRQPARPKEVKTEAKPKAAETLPATTRTKRGRRWPGCADRVAAVVLIVLFLVGMIVLSAVLAVRVAQESRELFDSTKTFIENKLPPGLGDDIRGSINSHE
jgi:uncharacterized membrane protein